MATHIPTSYLDPANVFPGYIDVISELHMHVERLGEVNTASRNDGWSGPKEGWVYTDEQC